jgi:hypothetical protein
MVEKFGIEWMDTLSPIWKEYHFALDQETHLYSLDSPLEAPHQYGLFRALEQGLIIIRRGRASLKEHLKN